MLSKVMMDIKLIPQQGLYNQVCKPINMLWVSNKILTLREDQLILISPLKSENLDRSSYAIPEAVSVLLILQIN